jgi:hypothetical protein
VSKVRFSNLGIFQSRNSVRVFVLLVYIVEM